MKQISRLAFLIAAVVVIGACSATSPVSEGQATTTVIAATTTVVDESPSTTERPAPTTTATTIEPPLPIIPAGMYIVPDEVAYGTYRHNSYMARLDQNQDIIDNDLVNDGMGLMIVAAGDAYSDISDEAILYQELGPVDPIVEGFTDGRYVVGYDLAPGRYRVIPLAGTAYWARLNAELEILDNDLGDGQLIVNVRDSDFALEFRGTLEPLP